MNTQARTQLIKRIKEIGLPDFSSNKAPLVTLEEFFEGNDYDGAIGCNLMPPIEPAVFYKRLKEIRAQKGVEEVLVEINEVEEGDESMWPFSDTVLVYGNLDPKLLQQWSEGLHPDEVGELPSGRDHYNPPNVSPNTRRYCLWWD